MALCNVEPIEVSSRAVRASVRYRTESEILGLEPESAKASLLKGPLSEYVDAYVVRGVKQLRAQLEQTLGECDKWATPAALATRWSVGVALKG
jgi:hypothetical protein